MDFSHFTNLKNLCRTFNSMRSAGTSLIQNKPKFDMRSCIAETVAKLLFCFFFLYIFCTIKARRVHTLALPSACMERLREGIKQQIPPGGTGQSRHRWQQKQHWLPSSCLNGNLDASGAFWCFLFKQNKQIPVFSPLVHIYLDCCLICGVSDLWQ